MSSFSRSNYMFGILLSGKNHAIRNTSPFTHSNTTIRRIVFRISMKAFLARRSEIGPAANKLLITAPPHTKQHDAEICVPRGLQMYFLWYTCYGTKYEPSILELAELCHIENVLSKKKSSRK